MNKHTFYKIISFVLLPIAAILGLFTVMFLFVALANPALLLPVFVMACVVIYIITSFIFLNKAIMMQKHCKRGLKDWIKVNAYVSVVFAVVTIFQLGSIIFQPQLLQQTLDNAIAMQPSTYQNLPKETMLKALKGMLYFIFGFSVLLLMHIFITFRLLRMYGHVFEEPSSNDPQ